MPFGHGDAGSDDPTSGLSFRAAAPTYLRRLTGRYQEALRAADHRGAVAVIDDALQRRLAGVVIQSEVIQPAMAWIGDLWAEGVITVADEHLATAITEEALPRLLKALRTNEPQSREKVLLAAVEGEQHVIGLRMVADVLAGAGFAVLNLGANVPTDALAAIVSEHEPAITGLSCTNRAASLVDALDGIDSTGVETRVMLGGWGVPAWLRGHPYPWVARSADVAEAVEKLLSSPPQSLPARLHRLLRTPKPGTPPTEAGDEPSVTTRELRNRNVFDERLTLCCKNEERGLVMMMEIDEWECDEQPAEAAGESPATLVEAMCCRIREHDVVARTGTSEFSVLLLGATREAAPQIASRLREEASRLTGGRTSVTIGLAPIGDDPRSALLAVDEALHAAKQTVGDRSAFVSAPGEPPEWLESLTPERGQQSDLPSFDEPTARVVGRSRQGRAAQLTNRQTEVLRALSEGKSTDQIASELFLTPVTVRNHIANLLAALGVHSRLQAVVMAKRRGLID